MSAVAAETNLGGDEKGDDTTDRHMDLADVDLTTPAKSIVVTSDRDATSDDESAAASADPSEPSPDDAISQSASPTTMTDGDVYGDDESSVASSEAPRANSPATSPETASAKPTRDNIIPPATKPSIKVESTKPSPEKSAP